MNKRAKQFTRLVNTLTGEIVVSAELTPAGVRRLIKEYARFGYLLEVTNA